MINTSSELYKAGQLVAQKLSEISNPTEPTNPIDSHKVVTYNSEGGASVITTYTDDTRATVVEVKKLSYTDGILTGITTEDASGNIKLTQTLVYDATGNLESIEKDYA